MYSTWKDVMRVCAESIYENEKMLAEMADMGIPSADVAPALATLHAQLELMKSLVATYLEELRR